MSNTPRRIGEPLKVRLLFTPPFAGAEGFGMVEGAELEVWRIQYVVPLRCYAVVEGDLPDGSGLFRLFEEEFEEVVA